MQKYFFSILCLVLTSFFFGCSTPQPLLKVQTASVLQEEPKIRVMTGGKRRARIVTLPLETYLAGVIGNEMSRRWPKEALKAQTVAARSYALVRMEESQKKGRRFDVVPTQADQVFRKKDIKNTYLKEIVSETKGEVLWSKGRVVKAFYSSTCGGRTRTPLEAGLSTDSPILECKNDKNCDISPFREWILDLDLKDIETRLNKHGFRTENLKSIKIKEKQRSGYVTSLEYKDQEGTHEISASQFRRIMGSMRLKSLYFTIHTPKKGTGSYIIGNGFGHGVGLCQYGAKQMAERGSVYTQILSTYYPKMEIYRIY